MLLQRLATGATGVKQARYRRGPTRGSEALYAHAQYNTQPVGPWHLLFNAWCNEFRRGFCTLVLSLEMERRVFVRGGEMLVHETWVELMMMGES